MMTGTKSSFSRFAAIALIAVALAAPLRAYSDAPLARMLEAAAGRFFVGQSIEGADAAARILSRPMSTQADFEELVARVRANQLTSHDAVMLNERIRSLHERTTGDIESVSAEELSTRLRVISNDLGVTLRAGVVEGRLEFMPERMVEGTFRTNTTAFLEGHAATGGRASLPKFEFDAGAAFADGADRQHADARAERCFAEDVLDNRAVVHRARSEAPSSTPAAHRQTGDRPDGRSGPRTPPSWPSRQ